MTRALVLSAGSSWAAYQMGALRHLVWDRHEQFDVYAGTGIGAMHAAMVACKEFEALEAFWRDIRAWRLLSPNWRSPGSDGPFLGSLQRRFLAAHVTEQRLRGEGVRLLVSTLDLQGGTVVLHSYPGAKLPLSDALAAAVATPGLVAPSRYGGTAFAEGTLVSSFPLLDVLDAGATDVIAIAAMSARASAARYETWRSVLERALALNLTQDVQHQVEASEDDARAVRAFDTVRSSLPGRLAALIEDRPLAERLQGEVARALERSTLPVSAHRVRLVAPSFELPYPLWRFRGEDLALASALGYRDARLALEQP